MSQRRLTYRFLKLSPVERRSPVSCRDLVTLGRRLVLCCALLLPVISCKVAGKLMSSLRDVQTTQSALARSLPGENIRINIMNGRSLSVMLVNSPLAKLPLPAKRVKSREIAMTAYRSYPSRSSLEAVTVVFMENTDAVVVHFSDGRDQYRYSAGELLGETGQAGIPSPAAPAADSGQ